MWHWLRARCWPAACGSAAGDAAWPAACCARPESDSPRSSGRCARDAHSLARQSSMELPEIVERLHRWPFCRHQHRLHSPFQHASLWTAGFPLPLAMTQSAHAQCGQQLSAARWRVAGVEIAALARTHSLPLSRPLSPSLSLSYSLYCQLVEFTWSNNQLAAQRKQNGSH